MSFERLTRFASSFFATVSNATPFTPERRLVARRAQSKTFTGELRLADGVAKLGAHRERRWNAALTVACALLFGSLAAVGQAVGGGTKIELASGFSSPLAITVDKSENLFVSDLSAGNIIELTAAGGYATKTTIVHSVDATQLTVDSAGNLYVADTSSASINEYTAASSFATVITHGSGFLHPSGVALDSTGNIFVADTGNNAVKEILASDSSIHTLGSGFNAPYSIGVDTSGNVFVADEGNSAVKEIVAAGGYTTVNTLLTGIQSFGIALDNSGNVFASVYPYNGIYEIFKTGGYTNYTYLSFEFLAIYRSFYIDSNNNLFAGGALSECSYCGSTSGAQAVVEIQPYTNGPGSRGFGSVNVGSSSASMKITFTLANGGSLNSSTPSKVVTQGFTGLDFQDAGSDTCNGGTTYNAGDTCYVNVKFSPLHPGQRFGAVQLFDSSGSVVATEYVYGTGVGSQLMFAPGSYTTVAGTYGVACLVGGVGCGNGGQATSASIRATVGIAVDAAGNMFVTDNGQNSIRKIDATSHVISAILGGNSHGTCSYGQGNGPDNCGDGGLASNATTYSPRNVAVDGAGNVYFSDARVRKIDAVTGIVNGVSGNTGTCPAYNASTGFCGDGGAATAALGSGNTFTVDGSGDIYVGGNVTGGGGLIRKVSAATGIINTIAGTGVTCSNPTAATNPCGDNGPATSAQLGTVISIAVDGAGNVFFSDTSATLRIRRIDAVSGIITTVAGNGTQCVASYTGCGDGGAATSAQLYGGAFALDAADDIFIADGLRIRVVNGTTGVISTLYYLYAGAGTTHFSAGVGTDSAGNVYFSDNVSVWDKIAIGNGSITFPTATVVSHPDATDNPQTLTVTNTGTGALPIDVPSSGLNPTIGGTNATAFSFATGGNACPQLDTSSSPASLAIGGSCQLSYNFTPVVTGSNTGTSTLTVNGQGFNVTLTGTGTAQTGAKLAYQTPPPVTLTAGQNAGTVVVEIEDAAGFQVLTASNSVTLKVTGPSSYSQTYTATASSGLASFDLSAVALNTPGAYTYTATSGALTEVVASETVNLGAGAKLIFNPGPTATINVGGNAGTLKVDEEDSVGNILTSSTDSITLTVTGPNGYSQTYHQAAVAGIATFNESAVTIPVGGSYIYTASFGSLTNAVATETVNGPIKLTFNPGPAASISVGGNAGTLRVYEQFANSLTSTGSTDQITVTVTGPNGYSQTYNATAVSGIATFTLTAVAINTAGTYTYTATSGTLTQAQATETVIDPNAPTALKFTTPPPAVVLQGTSAGNVTVGIYNGQNSVISTASNVVTLTVTGPGGYNQAYTATASHGYASFNLSSVPLSTLGAYTYTATSGALTPATAPETVVTVADITVTQLAYQVPPPATLSTSQSPGTVKVAEENAAGNVVTSATDMIVLTVTGPGGYKQTSQQVAVSGVATFSGLPSLASAGAYTYTATTYVVATPAVANEVVTGGAVTTQIKLAYQTPPPATLHSGQSAGTVVVAEEDTNGNVVTSANDSITLTVEGPAYQKVYTSTAVNGVATFSASDVLTNLGYYAYVANTGNLTPVEANELVSAAAANIQLGWELPPHLNGFISNLGAVNVAFEDYTGKAILNKFDNITLTVTGPGGFTETQTVAAYDGIAQFTMPTQYPASGLFTVTATSGSLPPLVATQYANGPQDCTPAAVSQFAINHHVETDVVNTSPGGGGSFQIDVYEMNANDNWVNTASDLITLTISGPGGYSRQFSGQAQQGHASIILTSLPVIATPGVYSITASNGTASSTIPFTVAASATSATGLANYIGLLGFSGGSAVNEWVYGYVPGPIASPQIYADEYTGSFQPDTSATDPITLTITGENGSQLVYHSAAVNGVAGFYSQFLFDNNALYHLTLSSGSIPAMSSTTLVGMPPSCYSVPSGTGAKLAFTSPPAPTLPAGGNAGSNVKVGVEDVNSNVILSNTDTVRLTVTGPNGYLASYSGTAVNGIATFDLSAAALNATGQYTYEATDGGLVPALANETVNSGSAAAPAQLAITAGPIPFVPAGSSAGYVQVSIEDASGNTITTASNSITLTVTGPGGYLQTYTASASNGVASFFNLSSAILNTTGVYTYVATSAALNQAEATDVVYSSASPGTYGAVASFAVFPQNYTVLQGTADALTVFALDANGNVVGNYTGPATLTTTDAAGSFLSTSVSFTNGEANTSVTLNTVGQQTITATQGVITGTSNPITVILPPPVVGPEDKLAFTPAPPANVTTGGNAGTVSVSIEDVNGNVETSSTDTVVLTVTGPGGYLQTYSATAVNGIATYNLSPAILNKAGQYTYTATDSGLTPASATENVTSGGAAGTATQLAFTPPPPAFLATGGNAGIVPVSVEDAGSNVVTSASNSITLTVTGPGGYTQSYTQSAVNGVASFNLGSAALSTAGGYTYTATSSPLYPAVATEVVQTSSGPGSFGSIASFAVIAQNYTVATNTADTLTVLALDQNGDIVGNFSGPATLTTTDALGSFASSSVNFTNGMANTTVTFRTTGQQTVTATQASITGTSAPITVISVAGPPAKLVFTTPPVPTVSQGGNAGTVAVSVEDVNGNVVTSATGTVTLTVTGPGGYLQTYTATIVNGVATFNLGPDVLANPGAYTYTATDGGLTPAVAPETVTSGTAGTPLLLAFTPPPPTFLATGGNAATVVVSVEDANSNVVTSSSKSITLTVTGPSGYSQTYTQSAVNGAASFNLSSVVLATSGVYTYTATASSVSPAVATEVVQTSTGPGNYGAAVSLAVIAQNYTVSKGTPDTLTVLALDANGNIVGNFSGPATLTMTDALGSFATSSVNFTNGVANTTGTFNTAGTQTVTATKNAITGTSSNITVLAGASGPPTAPVGGPTVGPITVTIPFPNTVTLGPISVLTLGAPNMDFKLGTGGTCTPGNTYNAAQSCTVNYTFTPTYPGLRKGAIQLTDNGGNVIKTIYISGIGISPEVAFANGTTSSLGSGFSNASGVALDGFNNVWATDPDNNQVKEILAAGGYTTVNTLPGSYNDPLGITVDGAGNVFVSDTGNRAVKEIVAAGGYTTVNTVNSGFQYPIGITVDEAGNLFVADSQANAVKELTVLSNYATALAVGSGFSGPQGVALDAVDNVYVADTAHNAIKEVTYSSDYTTVTTLGSGLLILQPVGIVLDAANNIYIANNGFNMANQLTVASGYTSMNTLAIQLAGIQQITLDGAGNVYAGVAGLNKVMKIDLSDGPTLNYSPQNDGTSSAPQSVVVNNIGNATLNAISPGLSVSAEFTQVAGGGTPPDCTAALGMTMGGSCNLSIEFTPITPALGTVNGSVLLTDNSLNLTNATQTVGLNGTAVLALAKLAFITPPTATLSAGGNAGSSITVGEEDSNGNVLTAATDSITLTVTGPNGYTATYHSTAVAGVATFNLSSTILTSSGSYTYTASLSSLSTTAPETVNPLAASVLTATGAGSGGQSMVIGGAYTNPFNVLVADQYGNTISGVTVNFSVPGSGASGTLSGSSAVSNSSGIASVTGTANGTAGTYNVTATSSGLTAITIPVTNTQATPAVTISALPATPIVYGSSQTSLSSTASYSTGTPTGDVVFYSGAGTLSPAQALTAGSVTYLAGYFSAGTYNFSAAYSGDNNYQSNTSTTLTYTINKAPTTITASNLQTVVQNSSGSNLTAVVAGEYSGSGINTPGNGSSGSVTYSFYNSSNALVAGPFTATLAFISGNEIAGLVVPAAVASSVGTYNVTVSFNGDINYLASTGPLLERSARR